MYGHRQWNRRLLRSKSVLHAAFAKSIPIPIPTLATKKIENKKFSNLSCQIVAEIPNRRVGTTAQAYSQISKASRHNATMIAALPQFHLTDCHTTAWETLLLASTVLPTNKLQQFGSSRIERGLSIAAKDLFLVANLSTRGLR